MTMSFFEELKRRNVIRVGIAYAVAAWLLLQIADLVLENIGAPGWVMQTIMLLLGIGFPLVMIFAWAFEMTPEGIKRERDVDRSQSITQLTGRKLDRAIIGVLTVAVAYLLVDKLVLEEAAEPVAPPEPPAEQAAAPAEPEGPSVAVLPFVNMSGDQENEYFSDGLTETLLHMLAQIPDLRVAARTSSFAFKGQNTSIAEVAETLGVAHILEGSVQKAQDRVRVTAQLIRADDGFHVWSQNYTRPLEDIFAIQDEIAADVSEALGASLLGEQKAIAGVETQDLDAYDSYLKGLEQQAIFSYGSLEAAESHFERALTLDPDFNDARLSLVRNYLLKNSTGLISNEAARAATDPLIRAARKADPENRLARALELNLTLQMFDPTRTGEEIAAIVNELRDMLHQLTGETHIRARVATVMAGFFRDHRTAIEILQAGLLVDPLAETLHSAMGDVYIQEDRLDDARRSYERAMEIAPGNPNNYADMSRLEKVADNLPAALDWMRRASEVDPRDHELASHIAEDLFALDLAEEGARWANRVHALAPGSDIARNLEVQQAFARGDYENAMDLAERAIADRIGFRQGAFFEVMFTYIAMADALGRQNEAWEFLLTQFPGLPDYGQVSPEQHMFPVQWASFALRAALEPTDRITPDWVAFTGKIEAMGFPWKSDPEDDNWIWDHLLKGEPDRAVERWLQYRAPSPLATNLERHKRFLDSLFRPVWGDPRVSAKLDDEARRFAALQDEVRAMLQRPEWN